MDLTIAEMIVQNRERYRRKIAVLRARPPLHPFPSRTDGKDQAVAGPKPQGMPVSAPTAVAEPPQPRPSATKGPAALTVPENQLLNEVRIARQLLERVTADLEETRTALPGYCRQLLQAIEGLGALRPAIAPSQTVSAGPAAASSPSQDGPPPSAEAEKVQIGDIASMIDQLEGYFK